jgi:hypothetical protein
MSAKGKSFRDAPPKPSPKETKALQGMVEGKSDYAAMKEAGYKLDRRSAEHLADRIKAKYTDANGALLVALEQNGVDLQRVAKAVDEGLNATKAVKSGKSHTSVPDYHTRHKYLETAIDVMGAKSPKQHVVTETKTHEQTIAIVDGLRSTPEAIALLQKKIMERSQRTIETSSGVIEDGPEDS